MINEYIYTDGACSANGKTNSTGGFGVFIAKSYSFDKPKKINYKGVHMKFNNEMFYITNIRMEGLAIVSTMAIYSRLLIDKIKCSDIINNLNEIDPFQVIEPKIFYGANELRSLGRIEPTTINIITDSKFWMNVIEDWLPKWMKKGIVMEKKNPDILLLIRYYTEKLSQNGIIVKFIHVRSHQTKGSRTEHADGNDIADELATSAVNNNVKGFKEVF